MPVTKKQIAKLVVDLIFNILINKIQTSSNWLLGEADMDFIGTGRICMSNLCDILYPHIMSNGHLKVEAIDYSVFS